MSKFNKVAIVKEIESPENPKAMDKRVSLIPTDTKKLVDAGVKVYVESGAGLGIGYSDNDYIDCGATIQGANEIYLDKDLIIKLKGPSIDSINYIKSGTTLLCMAHFHSFPDRAKLLQQKKINVIAMEEIYEMPKYQSDNRILGRLFTKKIIKEYLSPNQLIDKDIIIIGWSDKMVGVINRFLNNSPKSLQIQQPSTVTDLDKDTIYIYDSSVIKESILLSNLSISDNVFDINQYEKSSASEDIHNYRQTHEPYSKCLRRIQCLHETGRAGAKYGIDLLSKTKPNIKKQDYSAVVLGYGNVAQGAIHELYNNGVSHINVLGRDHTSKETISKWIGCADIIINGAEQPESLRGKNYIITNSHLRDVIPDNSVIIDLIGGSATNRSAVEPVINCTFLTEPYFVQDNVYVSSLWGWPMFGMMRESAIRYSGQIIDVLLFKEKLIDGLDNMPQNIKDALVCGVYK